MKARYFIRQSKFDHGLLHRYSRFFFMRREDYPRFLELTLMSRFEVQRRYGNLLNGRGRFRRAPELRESNWMKRSRT